MTQKNPFLVVNKHNGDDASKDPTPRFEPETSQVQKKRNKQTPNSNKANGFTYRFYFSKDFRTTHDTGNFTFKTASSNIKFHKNSPSGSRNVPFGERVTGTMKILINFENGIKITPFVHRIFRLRQNFTSTALHGVRTDVTQDRRGCRQIPPQTQCSYFPHELSGVPSSVPNKIFG